MAGTGEIVERVLAGLTPQSLVDVVQRLAAQRPAAERDNVEVRDVLAALGAVDLGPGAEGWGAQLRLKRALAEMAARSECLTYVEGDS